MQSGRTEDYCRWRTARPGVMVAVVELRGGNGGATPAVWEPSPSCCSVFASSFPEGFRPCDSWNFFMASTVDSSHFPLGFPVYEPSFPRACWISEMRSAAGAFCPRGRRRDFFKEFAWCAAFADFEEAEILWAVLCAFASAS